MKWNGPISSAEMFCPECGVTTELYSRAIYPWPGRIPDTMVYVEVVAGSCRACGDAFTEARIDTYE